MLARKFSSHLAVILYGLGFSFCFAPNFYVLFFVDILWSMVDIEQLYLGSDPILAW